MTTARAAALAIDGSEWFRDPAWRQHVSPRHWRRLPARAPIALRAAMRVLAATGNKATFLVPEELAALDADLVRELAAAGHEVALASEACAAGRQQLEALLQRRVHVYDAGSMAPAGERAQGAQFAAWRLDAEQPRLVGLPKAVFRAHYLQLADGERALRALAARGSCTLAQGLGLSLALPPSPPQALPSPRAPTARAEVPRLAIVVPLKDEEQGIVSLVVELDAVATQLADQAVCEFVFVDDGSSDRTWPLLQQHVGQRANVRLVQHASNRGVAAAIHSGVCATDAELVASIDGDLSYDPMELRAMLPLLAHADVVTASPYDPRGGVKNVPGWRLLLSRTLSRAYRLLLRRPIHTWTSCFRVYRRSAVVDLPVEHPGFLGTAELLVRVLRRGGRVVEHPCVLEARLMGFSKMRVLRTIGGHVRLLWQVARGRIS